MRSLRDVQRAVPGLREFRKKRRSLHPLGQTCRMPALRRLAAVCVLAASVFVPGAMPTAVGQAPAPAAVAAIPPVRNSATAAKPSLRLWSDCVTRVNVARAAAGKVAVTIDARLATAATTHSTYQAQIQKMTHVGSGSTNAGQRITAAGFAWSGWAENVAAGQGDCASVMSAWLNSPSHRTNILNSSYRYIGIGNVVGANGVRYWTMDLAV